MIFSSIFNLLLLEILADIVNALKRIQQKNLNQLLVLSECKASQEF